MGAVRILVLGGTQFFGRRLVHLLLADGHQVTVATRGLRADDFGDGVERLVVERHDPGSMRDALHGRRFDLVYDQICSDPRDARIAVEALGDRAGRYVYTSSMGVYPHREDVSHEDDLRPEAYGFDLDAAAWDFVEGKRQAEAYFATRAPFPVVSARVGMVISGTDDFTGRFDFYVGHVARGASIGLRPTEHAITFATAWDTAACLRLLGTGTGAVGPVNVANGGWRTARELATEIGAQLGTPARFHIGGQPPDDLPLSPYTQLPVTWKMSNARAIALGYPFGDIGEALPGIIRTSAERLGVADG